MSRLLIMQTARALAARHYSSHLMDYSKIGSREVVGYGQNGIPSYIDRCDFPMPAIRFKPETPDIKELRRKEKGDWKALSVAEKKALYRASFCQTFAEIQAPTGEWKGTIGCSLMITTACLWVYLILAVYVFPELPESFSEERRRAQLKRMLDLKMNPITGISSQWDYEKNEWKK